MDMVNSVNATRGQLLVMTSKRVDIDFSWFSFV